jgi:hypothetical protein
MNKIIVKTVIGVQNNPSYLDNINKYINYINGCEKQPM